MSQAAVDEAEVEKRLVAFARWAMAEVLAGRDPEGQVPEEHRWAQAVYQNMSAGEQWKLAAKGMPRSESLQELFQPAVFSELRRQIAEPHEDPLPSSAGKASPHLQQWEYMQFYGPFHDVHEMGREGWEMCGVNPGTEDRDIFYFKRPISR